MNGHPTTEHWIAATWIGSDQTAYNLALGDDYGSYADYARGALAEIVGPQHMDDTLIGYAWDQLNETRDNLAMLDRARFRILAEHPTLGPLLGAISLADSDACDESDA